MPNLTDRAIEYLNDYIDCMQNLPLDVQRHVTQLRECDLQYQEMISKVKDLTSNLTGNVTASDAEKLKELLVFGRDVGDRKVKNVQDIADMVDDKVGRLRNGRKFLTSIKEPKPSVKEKRTDNGNRSKERNLPGTSTGTASKEPKKLNTGKDGNESNKDVKIAKRPRRNRADEPDYKETSDDVLALLALQHSHNTPLPKATATAQVQSQVPLTKSAQKSETKTKKKSKYKKQSKDNAPSYDDAIAVDPDEPTYCLCDQISYGEMVCCDNDLCPIEWFHFSCVSLSTNPKGKWFCPKCRGDRPNIMKPKAEFLKELERYNKEKEDKA